MKIDTLLYLLDRFPEENLCALSMLAVHVDNHTSSWQDKKNNLDALLDEPWCELCEESFKYSDLDWREGYCEAYSLYHFPVCPNCDTSARLIVAGKKKPKPEDYDVLFF